MGDLLLHGGDVYQVRRKQGDLAFVAVEGSVGTHLPGRGRISTVPDKH